MTETLPGPGNSTPPPGQRHRIRLNQTLLPNRTQPMLHEQHDRWQPQGTRR